ncbi:MAG: hypothetical protein SFX18_13925 [Pirellulales bacterium]|nr:hypothetical protein [Pirellulales bacterium]
MDQAWMVDSLRGADQTKCLTALAACQNNSALDTSLVMAVLPLTAHPHESIREQAVEICEGMQSPPAELAIPLTTYLPTARGDAAYWCVTLLGRLAGESVAAISVLATCLERHELLAVRERAAWALGKIGPAAQKARPSLEKAAAATDPRLSRLAKDALEAIGE